MTTALPQGAFALNKSEELLELEKLTIPPIVLPPFGPGYVHQTIDDAVQAAREQALEVKDQDTK